jgi:patatin-related protein
MKVDNPSKAAELTQEVRLATTMTGGVSLAIWMAGVTREINLLGQASQWRRAGGGFPDHSTLPESAKASLKLYKALIDFLDIVVDVDILSGTSAGGINAALLALSRVKGKDLGGLRDLWLDLGALLDLIRDPTDKNTPSLLYGDERLFAVLAEQLPKLETGPFPPAPKAPPPTTLYVTTTLLTGETSRFTDSFGTLVQDVDRRGVFTFTDRQLDEDKVTEALALAARSSASFPAAFEPSFVPFNQKTHQEGAVPVRPAMDAYANITRPHWVADGGLLDNQPIDLLLQRIFDSPATRPVRRVLLFVVPSSGPAPDAEATPEDSVDKPLGLVDGLLKDLSAMTSQSIAADLRAIRAHQDRMEARSDARLRLAELARRLRSRLLTKPLLLDYRTREATKQADTLSTALLRQLSTCPPEPATSIESIPKNWQDDLAVGGDAEKVCRRGITGSILGHWPAEPLPRSLEDFAAYGRPAYELAKGCAISIARAAYLLAESTADPTACKEALATSAELTAAIHDAYKPPELTDLSTLVREVRTSPHVRQYSLGAAAAELAAKYFGQFTFPKEAWENLARAVLDKYEALADLAANTSSATGAIKGSLREQDSTAASQLDTYLNYLRPTGDPQSPEATLWVARQLFDLAVTQRAMLPAEADIDQSVELVQVSADTRSLLALNFQTAQEKLTGMQFHHFGAFYKRSWRANDWMWGRLDGAGWLVHVLLDPRRVRWVVQMHSAEYTPAPPREKQPGARWLLEELTKLGAPEIPKAGYELPDAADGSRQTLTEDTLRKELRFIDDASEPIPASIPWTSLWLAQVWQQRVLDEELDGLAMAVIDPQPGKPPDWSPATSRTWAEKVQAATGDAKYARLKQDPVAKETFSTDAGSPLMAHTITKLAATASSAARSVRQLPGVLKPPLVTVQTLALGGYRVVSATNGVASRFIEIGAVLLALGILGAIQNSTLLGFGGLAVAGIGSYSVVLGTWQSSNRPGTLRDSSEPAPPSRIRRWRSRVKAGWRASRIRRWLSKAKTCWRGSRLRRWLRNSKVWRWISRPLVPLLSVTLVGAVLSLAAPVVRRGLFGTGQKDSGVVGSHVYWLGAQWWHPLIVVVAIALVITIVGIAVGRPGRK